MNQLIRKMKKEKKTTGGSFFSMAMLCYLGLGFDAIAILIDILLFGELAQKGFDHYTWYMKLWHSGIVILVWGFVIGYMLKRLQKRNLLTEVVNPSMNKAVIVPILFAITISSIFTRLEQIFSPSTIPQIIGEYHRFQEAYSEYALILSIAQNIYYVFEVGLVVLLLALMQKAGEEWFRNQKLPFGAVGLALTWGIGHIMHGGWAALWVMSFSLVAGLFFTLCKKNCWATYIFIIFIFII